MLRTSAWTVGLAVAAIITVAASGVAVADNQLQIVGVTDAGRLLHAIRFQDGSWTGFGDVEGQAGDIGTVVDAEAVTTGGDTQVAAIAGGRLFHTIRFASGAWAGFGDVDSVAGNPGTHTSVGMAKVDADMHLCTTTSSGALWHTIRFANGTWSGFGDVKAAAGNDPGSFTRVDCSGIAGELHVVATTTAGVMWHTVRRADGSWVPFGNVNSVTGTSASFQDADCSNVNGVLQVVGTAPGLQLHAIRRFDGPWYPFGDVASVAGDMGDEQQSSTAQVGGELHLVLVTADGGLFHTIRFASGVWSGYGDVRFQTGTGERFTRVGLAGRADSAVAGATGNLPSFHWRSINDMPPAERAELVNLMATYINDTIVNEHTNSNWHHQGIPGAERFFTGHRGYISRMEAWLLANGGAQYVPLPYWDPGTTSNPKIPSEFTYADPHDDGTPRTPIQNQNPTTQAMPAAGFFPNVCSFGTAAELAQAVESPWHDGVHCGTNGVGGTFCTFADSPATALFWAWHSFVDNIYSRYHNCP